MIELDRLTEVSPASEEEIVQDRAIRPKLLSDFTGQQRILEQYEVFLAATNPYSKVASSWFYGGLPGDTIFEPREGVDTRKALRHVAAI